MIVPCPCPLLPAAVTPQRLHPLLRSEQNPTLRFRFLIVTVLTNWHAPLLVLHARLSQSLEIREHHGILSMLVVPVLALGLR